MALDDALVQAWQPTGGSMPHYSLHTSFVEPGHLDETAEDENSLKTNANQTVVTVLIGVAYKMFIIGGRFH